ncbi:MAG: hypothetical protein AMXMBFR64_58730 [Myxococcales bacterium]
MHAHPTNIVPNLLAAHRAQDAMLTELRAALVGGQTGRANDLLRQVDGKLRRHFQYEEELLLPAYEARLGSELAGSASELICVEHRRVEELLDRARVLLDGLNDATPVDQVLALADAIARMEHILEHHDRREADAFDPLLDDLLELDERTEILRTIGMREVGALLAEVGLPCHDDAIGYAHAPELPPNDAPGLDGALDACAAWLCALRYMLATDAASDLPHAIDGVRLALDALDAETAGVAKRADERFRKLVEGQREKMRMHLGRVSACVAAGLPQDPPSRWASFVKAYGPATTLAGLLDNHAVAVRRQASA